MARDVAFVQLVQFVDGQCRDVVDIFRLDQRFHARTDAIDVGAADSASIISAISARTTSRCFNRKGACG